MESGFGAVNVSPLSNMAKDKTYDGQGKSTECSGNSVDSTAEELNESVEESSVA